MKDKDKIEGYDFSSKKETLNRLFNKPEHQEYSKNKKKVQAKKEKIYKFTSIGNSTDAIRNLIIVNTVFFIISLIFPSIMTDYALYNIDDSNFKFYQILTSMF